MTSRYADVHKAPQGLGDSRPTAIQIIKDEQLENKLQGKAIFITGCSSGIGVESAKALFLTGATLYLTARNLDKARQALGTLLKSDRVHLLELDLNSLASVRSCASEFLQQCQSLNILICNAGVMTPPEGRTEDGFETQFGTNHLAHFLLFNLLQPALLAGATPELASRVVVLSSVGHRFGEVPFDNVNFDGKYDAMAAYASSKTANLWTANEIERRYGSQGIHAWSVQPGAVMTELIRHTDGGEQMLKSDPYLSKILKNPAQGAATSVWGATDPALEGQGGKYLEDCQIAGLCLHALENEIKPHLPPDSLEAQSSLKTVSAVLSDLISRYAPKKGHRPLLRGQLEKAAILESDLRAVLKSTDETYSNVVQSTTSLSDDAPFEEISRRYEEISDRISYLAQRAATCNDPEVPALLRQAAEWEAAYYVQIAGISQDALTSYYESDEIAGKASKLIMPTELTSSAVEAFLRNSRSDSSIKVSNLSRLAGGHGKQTYVCDVSALGLDDEETATLVIRKEDPAPIILRSTFRIAEEFALLRDLSGNTDFPCPQPFEVAVPAPYGVDAPFFTMTKLKGAIGSLYLGSESSKIDESMAKQLANLLARLHTYPLKKFSYYFTAIGEEIEIVEKATIADRYRKSVDSWTQYVRDVDHLPSPFMTWLLSWLKKHIPDDGRTPVLSHGDFSIHNLLQLDGETTGVLDWECAEFLSPEQDLAYLQPLLSKSYPWEKFLAHYHEAGGSEIRESLFPFVQAYAVLRTMLAFNRATRNLIVGDSRDVRFLMVEYGYCGAFMGIGLEYTSRHPSYAAIQAATKSIDKLEDDASQVMGQNVIKKDAHGAQAKALAVRGDETKIRQPHGSTSNWQNSVVLVWWDQERQVGSFHRLGHEPNRSNGGEAIIWTNLITPQGMFKRVQSNPLRKEDMPDDGSFGSGDEICFVKYADGEHVWTINEAKESISARIEHRDTGPNVDCFPKHGTMDKDFSTAHFDIPGRVSGNLTIKGQSYNIEGLSVRDHAWGNRDWGESAYGHRWLVGTAGTNFSFMAVSWHATANDRIGNFGWVVRHGIITLAKSTDIIIFMEVDSFTNRGGKVRMELTTGDVLDIECDAAAPKASVCWHLGMACVDRICSFKCKQNGVFGFANVESTCNIQLGNRMPQSLVGGFIENGYTSFESN